MIHQVVLLLLAIVSLGRDGNGAIMQFRRERRLIGGFAALPKQYPYHVTLKTGTKYSCGGSLIHPRWVLTAAHCLLLGQQHTHVVEAGLTRLSANHAFVQRRRVARVFHYPHFHRLSRYNDIGLAMLDNPINIEASEGHIGVVSLPHHTLRVAGNVTMTGYGYLNEGSPYWSDTLHAITAPVLSDTRCYNENAKFRFLNSAFHYASQDSMFCAHIHDDEIGACYGESGGPAVMTVADEKYVVGVASMGDDCVRAGRTTIFSEVPYFVPWLRQTMGVDYPYLSPLHDDVNILHPIDPDASVPIL